MQGMKSKNLIVFLTSFSLFQWLPHNNVKKLIFLSLTMCTIGEAHTNQNYITRQHLVIFTSRQRQSCTSKEAVNPLELLGRTFLAENSHLNDNSTIEPTLIRRIFANTPHRRHKTSKQCNAMYGQGSPTCLWYIQIEPCVTSDFSFIYQGTGTFRQQTKFCEKGAKRIQNVDFS